ncbi:MAG TPA: MFS transporter [Terracidiphilus sp.]|nr:MFS transporter [Candidatus Sulfotelmatobacter sp.]HUN82729.1 MFS transporter [Terracidiphilus sp.]
MSSSVTTLRPSPFQVARATAAGLPSEISKSPLLGILGVIIGAGVVTLTGRMISLGLADLKGGMGFGFDDGSWISSSYNIALMFIGPFTVYLGALLGARRILLLAATSFTLICLLAPFIHNYSLMIVVMVLAGLTSGTFYPLTLTFALRNIPLRFLPYTIALYATFVDGAVNIAPSLYGWYREHLSWHWIFWNSAVITVFMMICIYFGIPKPPAAKESDPAPSFAGFLYWSAGLAMLYAAIDQGERLDWWRSGLFNALFFGAAFLVVCAIVRRLRMPNPLVAVPYLRQWNTILLAIALFFFRFCLVSTIILIPQSLAVQGFVADQIGPAVIWSALPLLIIAFIAGLLLANKADSRFLMASGFVCMAFACYMNADLTSAWSASNYDRTELLMGVGQAFAFIGLVGGLILQGIFSGGMSKPERILTFSAFIHTVRIFGGNLGAVYMGHFIAQREKLHSNLLGLHVQTGNWITDSNIHQLATGLFSRSSGAAAATGRAVGVISARLRLQAYTLSINDGFYLVAWGCAVMLLLTALVRRSPLSYGDLTAIQEQLHAPEGAKS